jgi:hypothetical protein
MMVIEEKTGRTFHVINKERPGHTLSRAWPGLFKEAGNGYLPLQEAYLFRR